MSSQAQLPNGNTQNAEQANSGQFSLLRERRFAPFFWTQFLGAGNDNLFKFAFTIMVTYQLQVQWLRPEMAGLVIGALFILPFLLFSATSGQLADKFEKSRLIRILKWTELGIMLVAAAGFYFQQVPVLLACIFLMGLQSTVFGPVKYAYLPQQLNERELTGGNGLVESGTFVAILLGNVAGGLLVAIDSIGQSVVAIACIALAIAGRFTAGRIPVAPPTDPGLQINWNPVSETWRNLKLARTNMVVFRSILGISWMWFFGAVFLSQFPAFARDILGGDESVASALLVVFSVGIGIGSLACEMLSRRHVEIGLVPFGAIGMSVFAIDLYFATRGIEAAGQATVWAWLQNPSAWRVMADLLLLSLFTGLYSVPMYALIQSRSRPTHRARIIAANNIINAIFMIVSSVLAGLALQYGMTIPQVFLAVAILNALVAAYIFSLVPEYLLRFAAWIASRFVYRFRVVGDQHIPEVGPAILAANHVSFVDAVLLMAASPRPITFLMDHRIFKTPGLGMLFRLARAIPVAPRNVDEQAYDNAMKAAVDALEDGQLLGIFPEGKITSTGDMQPFRPGLLKIRSDAREALQSSGASTQHIPVIPIALQNLWGSFFSRIDGPAMRKPFRRGPWSRVGIHIGPALPASETSVERLQAAVTELLRDRLQGVAKPTR
jgi:1-acyl-sn-glycerol-3-phosphate acyltransferase